MAGIEHHYRDKVERDPQATLVEVEQELASQWVRLGNDWTGRGVVMDTVIGATIEGLEIVRAACRAKLEADE